MILKHRPAYQSFQFDRSATEVLLNDALWKNAEIRNRERTGYNIIWPDWVHTMINSVYQLREQPPFIVTSSECEMTSHLTKTN